MPFITDSLYLCISCKQTAQAKISPAAAVLSIDVIYGHKQCLTPQLPCLFKRSQALHICSLPGNLHKVYLHHPLSPRIIWLKLSVRII